MIINLISAVSRNGVIGKDLDIPWKANGEQLLFKALTYNQWVIVGRRTFESMGILPNRKYMVITHNPEQIPHDDMVYCCTSIDGALKFLEDKTDQVFICGGGILYSQTIYKAHFIHKSVIDIDVEGDITFPPIPSNFELIYSQNFISNINYEYQIWNRII